MHSNHQENRKPSRWYDRNTEYRIHGTRSCSARLKRMLQKWFVLLFDEFSKEDLKKEDENKGRDDDRKKKIYW